MIWGRTHTERHAEFMLIHKYYAYFPKQLTDGRWVWLEDYYSYYWVDHKANWAGDHSHHRFFRFQSDAWKDKEQNKE